MHAWKFAETELCLYSLIDLYHLDFAKYSKPSASVQKRILIVEVREETENIKDQPYTPRSYVNSEMTPIFDQKSMNTNPFGLRLVLSSTYSEKMSSKLNELFGYLPRK